ncbi:hypothetical protein [Parabacteroides sp.]
MADMTVTERKQLLMQRIWMTSDAEVLQELERLLDIPATDSVLCFSPALRDQIDRALSQMKEDDVLTDEEMEKEMSVWLEN